MNKVKLHKKLRISDSFIFLVLFFFKFLNFFLIKKNPEK